MAFVDSKEGGRVIEWHEFPVKITMDEICEPGDLIAYDGAWKKADGNVTGKAAVLIAGQRCSATSDGAEVIQAYARALIDFGSACTATVGALIYLSDDVGEYTDSAGTSTQVLGFMVDARRAIVEPKQPIAAGIADPATTQSGSSVVSTTVKTILDVLYAHGMLRQVT